MDAFDLISSVHDRMDSIYRDGFTEESTTLDREPGFKTWYAVALNRDEVERVGRSLAALFGITLDEID